MADSLLFKAKDSSSTIPAVLVEAVHNPDSLAAASGVYISAAGSAMLQSGKHDMFSSSGWLWIAVESGNLDFHCNNETLKMAMGESCMFSAGKPNLSIDVTNEARILWLQIDGSLSDAFMQRMGAFSNIAMKQGALPSQLNIAKHIVQAAVRLSVAQEASSAQLQQLLWAMLASHNGQPVAMDAVMSHEIAKVVDTMRKNQYKDSFSLADMANISRMPVETFRKRFVAEVGMPPQSYQLYCKMERAKALLKSGYTVRQAGVEVGMSDPYHFSKTFKNIVGMSPSSYAKAVLR